MNINDNDLLEKNKQYEVKFDSQLDSDNMDLVHVIRCDGKNFKQFTKGLDYPFDSLFRNVMELTMLDLCKEVQGAFLGYTQSDEITVMFRKNSPESQIYYNGRVSKIIGVTAGFVTKKFNENLFNEYEKLKNEYIEQVYNSNLSSDAKLGLIEEFSEKNIRYREKVFKAGFDSRVFSMPTYEAFSTNLISRWKNSKTNAVSMIAQANFSHNELQNVKTEEQIKMLSQNVGIDVESIDQRYIYGVATYKRDTVINEGKPNETARAKWFLDRNTKNLPEKEAIRDLFYLDFD